MTTPSPDRVSPTGHGRLRRLLRKPCYLAGVYGLITFQGASIVANLDWKKRIADDLKDSSDEVRFCAKRAEFVGKWLASSGSSGTVMSILGVRP